MNKKENGNEKHTDDWLKIQSRSKLEEMKTFYLQKKVKFSDLSVWLKAVVVFGWIMLTIWMLILMLDVVVFMIE